jgi:hypothetical protein
MLCDARLDVRGLGLTYFLFAVVFPRATADSVGDPDNISETGGGVVNVQTLTRRTDKTNTVVVLIASRGLSNL